MRSQAIPSRQLSQRSAFGLLILATIIVVIPVLFIITYIIVNGAGAIDLEFLTQPPSQAGKAGGIFPAIVGTFLVWVGGWWIGGEGVSIGTEGPNVGMTTTWYVAKAFRPTG